MIAALPVPVRCVLLALALCFGAASASAHAPLPRAVAVSPSGAGVALALPGFGLLIREIPEGEFSYACDALLGIPTSDRPAALQYFDDESLLIGSAGGLRSLGADGCPRQANDALLAISSITALAIHPETQVAYVIAAGHGDGVWRSTDRGEHWERRGSFEGTSLVTGLAIDPSDPMELFVTRTESGTGSTLLVSRDGGLSFTAHPQERALSLLAVRGAASQVWAVARALDSVANRGFDILRADESGGAFRSMLRVNFFGGFSAAPTGEIWVGDEGGGIYRSSDEGETFGNVDARSRIACLASTADSVWACTPDLPSAPALKTVETTSSPLQPRLALTDVEQLVACPNVANVCGAAWVEWQRDVLMRDLTATDAGLPPMAAAPDAGEPVVQQPPAPTESSPQQPTAGCAVVDSKRSSAPTAGAAMLLAAVLLGCVLRRTRWSR